MTGSDDIHGTHYVPSSPAYDFSTEIVPFAIAELASPFRLLPFDAKRARIWRLKECEWTLVPLLDVASMNRIVVTFQDILIDVSTDFFGNAFPPAGRKSVQPEAELAREALEAFLRCMRFNAEWCRRRNPNRVHESLPDGPDEWDLRAELAKRLRQCSLVATHCLAEVLMQGQDAYALFDQLRDHKAVDVAALFERCPKLSIW